VARVTLEPGREKSLVWDATDHREGEGWSWSPGDSFSSSPEKQSHSANPNSVAPPWRLWAWLRRCANIKMMVSVFLSVGGCLGNRPPGNRVKGFLVN
jgi:hypothetical protein